jgi:hypothetical protein
MGPEIDLDPIKWIAGTPYSQARKRSLIKTAETSAFVVDPKSVAGTCVKCFGKHETYDCYKHLRGIYARVDEFKVRVGPFFHYLEDVVYGHPEFIKHVPIQDRPQYVRDRLELPGSIYVATDYTAFESHFTPGLLEACEFQLYRHYASRRIDTQQIVGLYCDVAGGVNKCDFKDVRAYILARRMSGEMSTSLGNGFTNFMVFLVVCDILRLELPAAVVEGDDCLWRLVERNVEFCFESPGYKYSWPVARARIEKMCRCMCANCAMVHRLFQLHIYPMHDHVRTVSELVPLVYQALGFNIKIEFHRELSCAGFCSMNFDPDVLVIVPSPVKKILNFGWVHGKYLGASVKTKRELLRGKALSLMCESIGVPILQSFAMYMLRITHDSHFRIDDWWMKEKLRGASFSPRVVDFRTRLVMEKIHGFSVPEQLCLERYFDGLNDRIPVFHPLINDRLRPVLFHYNDNYVFERPMGKHPCIPLQMKLVLN